MATVLWGAPTTDTLTWGTALSALPSGSYSLSSEVDNTSGLYENALFYFTSTAATGSNVASGGFIGLTTLYAPDGSTYPNPGSAGSATGIPQVASIPGLSGATFTHGHSGSFLILPFKFKILLYNGFGIALPTGTIVASLKRFAETIA
jgi:hypothetical protein